MSTAELSHQAGEQASIEDEAPEPLLTNADASYDPADNKLRLRAATKLPRDLYDSLKALGFGWAPKQGAIYATWTPEREDRLLALVGEIGDEDTSLVERAEARAERFEGYQENRAADAERAHAAVHAIADNIPMGQPILVGHHSEKHARRDAKRIENGMRKAVSMWETAKYWERRAKAAIRHAKYKELPAVRFRRIKGIETDKRREEKQIEKSTHYAKLWAAPGLSHEMALKIANYDSHSLPVAPGERWGETLWGALDKGKITAEEAAVHALATHARIMARAERWIAHCDNRLAYERALLAEAADAGGGLVTQHHEVAVGGKVLAKHWRTSFREVWLVVKRVNRGSSGEVQSVSTPDIPIEDVKGYEAPTAENVAKVKAASKLAPLVNYPGEGFVEMTRARWDRHSAEDRKARTAKATETHGAYRYRMSWVPGGSFKTAQVFLTDEKVVERPALAPAPEPVHFEREIAEPKSGAVPRAPRPAAEPTKFDAMKEQLKSGVRVVVADQLFPTPAALAERVVEAAGVAQGHDVLEPSAGTGALVRAAQARSANVRAIEIRRELADVLHETTRTECADFLSCTPEVLGTYDAVVMNPPFAGGADIDHVRHAFSFLKPGGKLVAIMSAGVKFKEDRKTTAFRHLIAAHGELEDLPEDSFKESGTSVRTVMVTLIKEATHGR